MVCVNDFCIDDSLVITVGVILDVVLITVLIAQSRILSAQATHYRRTSQVTLRAEKFSKIQKLTEDLNVQIFNKKRMDNNTFDKLTMILYGMHYLFKEQVLKPVDFVLVFQILWAATLFNKYYETKTYRNRYLILQIIFNDFNRDVNGIVRLMLNQNSKLDNQIEWLKLNKISKMFLNKVLHDWPGFQTLVTVDIWLAVHIRRKKHFKLIPPP